MNMNSMGKFKASKGWSDRFYQRFMNYLYINNIEYYEIFINLKLKKKYESE